MSELAGAWPWLAAMAVLILFSGLFSGSEAALFSLSARQRRQFSRSGTGGRMTAALLQDPERLLSAILFWNLLINMTYFGIASIIGARLESSPTAGPSTAVAFTLASLLTIIFLSEMLPKSVAVLAPVPLALLVGPALTVAVRVVSPILPLLKVSNLAASRLLWPSFEPEPELELADIERAIELGTDDAALVQRERLALRGLVAMAETRAVELMRPRSRLRIAAAPVDRSVLAEGDPPSGYLMVTEPQSEEITASIAVRSLRPSQLDDLHSAAEPVIYAPWSARVAQVLDQLNDEDRSVAVVVNEFGEGIGVLSVDDILSGVLAPSEGRDEPGDSIRQLGPDHYRFSGSLSLRTLLKQLELELSEERFTSVAGYIQRSNERLPRPGDVAPLGPYELVVVEQSDEGTWIEARIAPAEEES